MQRVVITVLLLVAAGCPQAPPESPSTAAPAVTAPSGLPESQIGRSCSITFRLDGLGCLAAGAIVPVSSNVVLVGLEPAWLAYRTAQQVVWIPRSQVLTVRFTGPRDPSVKAERLRSLWGRPVRLVSAVSVGGRFLGASGRSPTRRVTLLEANAAWISYRDGQGAVIWSPYEQLWALHSVP